MDPHSRTSSAERRRATARRPPRERVRFLPLLAFLFLALCAWTVERAEPERRTTVRTAAEPRQPPPPSEDGLPASLLRARRPPPAAADLRVPPRASAPFDAGPRPQTTPSEPVPPSEETGLEVSVGGGRDFDGPTVIELTHVGSVGQGVLSQHVSALDGALRIPLGPGKVRAVARRGAGVSRLATVELLADGWTPLVLTLERARPVEGRVVSSVTGEPIAQAQVAFWTFAETDVVRTDAEGFFSHPRFPHGSRRHQLRATAPGYGPATAYLQLEEGGRWRVPAACLDEAPLEGAGVPFVELALPPELTARGRVVDPEGRPVAGAEVSLEGFVRVLPRVASRDAAAVRTADDGTFLLRGLRDDVSHGLRVGAEGFACLEAELAADLGTHELGDLVLWPEQLLAGVVLEADGHPVVDLEVRLEPVRDAARGEEPGAGRDVAVRVAGTRLETRTCQAGTFLFEGLAPGKCTLELRRQGALLHVAEVELPLETELVLWLREDIAVLAGEVVDRGSRVVGALVRVETEQGSVRLATDGEGRFRVPGLRPRGAYTVTATWERGGRPCEVRTEAAGDGRVRLAGP